MSSVYVAHMIKCCEHKWYCRFAYVYICAWTMALMLAFFIATLNTYAGVAFIVLRANGTLRRNSILSVATVASYVF